MKQFIVNRLGSLARAIIAKYKPTIIGITGSVGKTSTRDAIFNVVRTKYTARKPDKNYNNEIGLPLTIIGADAPGRKLTAWIKIFLKAYGLLWMNRTYPQVLILEMGVDHPGDMDHLLSIAKPHIAVITHIGSAHYEFFKTQEALIAEKRKIIERLGPGNYAILNADSDVVMSQRGITPAKVVTYGVNNPADVKISIINEELSFPARTRIQANGVGKLGVDIAAVGMPHISACAAAIAVAQVMEIEPDLIQKGLRDYRPQPGRFNILGGIKETVILEDSYNASPDSVTEALQTLARMPNKTKVAVLGDMLELGEMTEEAHHQIGEMVAQLNIDQLITVGSSGQLIAFSAERSGFPQENVQSFPTSDDAKEYLQNNLIPGSAILVKGSQGVRMERVSKEILANPMGAHNDLPRQYGKWIK